MYIEITNQKLNFASTGVLLLLSSEINIHHNVMANNSEFGIYQDSSSNGRILSNTIANNSRFGIGMGFLTKNNVVRYNNFINNNNHASDEGSDNEFFYNYWSGWITPDDNNDGIVDIDFPIIGLINPLLTTNVDQFPKTIPFDVSLPVISTPTTTTPTTTNIPFTSSSYTLASPLPMLSFFCLTIITSLRRKLK